ncbi:hypothetical protein IAR50_004852 [Cryptococcus sp. DSM 104548]
MKKKKKKVAVAEPEESSAPAAEPSPEPTPAAAPAAAPAAPEPVAEAPVAESSEKPAEDGGDLFADLKKKKKKKKDIPADLEDAPAATVDGLDIPVKKKKSKKTTDFSKELEEMETEQNEAAAEEGDLGDDPFAKASGADPSSAETLEAGKEPWVIENREPTYAELLKRFFSLLHAHNPELAGEKRRYTIVPPQVQREGAKKTNFSNVMDICRRMRRQPEHVIMFLYSELGTTGSVDGTQRLVMKGKFTQKQIENVLRKYIVEYVTCKICKSPDTILGKENRLYFMTCESCGSRRSVSAIKAGFQAQVGKRIKTG